MKQILLFISISLFTFSAINAQESKTELFSQRNQRFQQYKEFKDTLTIRTWSNMVELSKRLEAVVSIDNILFDSLMINSPKRNINLETRVSELTAIKDQLIGDNARLNAEYTTISKQKGNYIFIIVVLIILLTLLTISWIRNFVKFKHIEKSSNKSNEKLLNLKQAHKVELDQLKDEIQKLKDDQLLMENTASQMKKSYEILKTEQSYNYTSEGPSEDDGIEEVRKEMEEISAEVSSILEEKQRIEEELKLANQELVKYQSANKTIEDELIKHQGATRLIEEDLELLLRKLKNE